MHELSNIGARQQFEEYIEKKLLPILVDCAKVCAWGSYVCMCGVVMCVSGVVMCVSGVVACKWVVMCE